MDAEQVVAQFGGVSEELKQRASGVHLVGCTSVEVVGAVFGAEAGEDVAVVPALQFVSKGCRGGEDQRRLEIQRQDVLGAAGERIVVAAEAHDFLQSHSAQLFAGFIAHLAADVAQVDPRGIIRLATWR